MSLPPPLEAIFERYLDTNGLKFYNSPPSLSRSDSKSQKITSSSKNPSFCSRLKLRSLSNPSPVLACGAHSNSSQIASFPISPCFKPEDLTAPVLDRTAELFADPKTDFNNVTVVFCDKLECPVSRQPSFTNRLRSVSLLNRRRSSFCKTLMRALSNSDEAAVDPFELRPTMQGPETEADHVINFYSFADALCGENNLERFNSRKMSEVLNSISDLEDDIDGNDDHDDHDDHNGVPALHLGT